MTRYSIFLYSVALMACGSHAGSSTGDGSSGNSDTGGIKIGDVSFSDTSTSNGPDGSTAAFDGVINADTACTSGNFSSTAKPPIIAFLLDRSLSMSNYPSDPTGNGGSYFPTSYTAPAGCPNLCNGVTQNNADFATTKFGYLRTAIDQLMSTGNLPQDWQVSFTFFQPPGISDTTSAAYCAVGSYSTPQIKLNTVATNHPLIDCWTGISAIANSTCTGLAGLLTEPNPIFCSGGGRGGTSTCTYSLAPVLPTGLTPMGPALQGAITYLADLTQDSAGNPIDATTKRVVVLLTDGAPTICDGSTLQNNNLAQVQSIAAAGLATTPSVTTYTIGVPGAAANLADVATSGGGKGFTISATDSSFITQLVADFEAIATSSMSCSFPVPTPPNGQTLDPNAVAVDLIANGKTTTIARDLNNANGWNYTNGGADITLFGAACTTVQSDPAASIQILAVCQTDATACSGLGGSCGGEVSCCLGYHCDSTTNSCLQNGVVVQ